MATLGEAEVFADAGLGEIFVAYPLWADRERAPRLRALAGRVRLAAGVDSLASVHQLAAAVQGHAGLRVLVEVDCGLRRSGVAPADAGRIATAAARAGLAVDGVFTFPGAQLRAGHAREGGGRRGGRAGRGGGQPGRRRVALPGAQRRVHPQRARDEPARPGAAR